MKYKVTVVVPVYRVEQYIERCARSLMEQTLDSIEYIFVDDCTDDHSVDILKSVITQYSERRGQTQIINFGQNRGLAVARRTAIQAAQGEYVISCDSDDWVDHDAYRLMYELAVKEDDDIVICNYQTTDGKNHTTHREQPGQDKVTFINEMLYGKRSWSLCNKLVRRSIFDHIEHYPSKSMGEDMAVTLQLYYYAQRTGYIDKVLYNYYQHPMSIINSRSEAAVFSQYSQAMDNTNLVLNFYRDKDIEPKIYKGLNYMSYHNRNLLLPNLRNRQYLSLWRQTYPGIDRNVMMDSNAPLKERIKCLLSLLHLYPTITNLLGFTICK
ncbi:MAG: glycosyltransferase family 2 protein [Prevotellaceae bacterium]|nr:glycosyltransferase family 2 protein [Prevotellaceae bacterium]MDY3856124.1 glycosyltransferase family 2 protein [Bacteroidaceae bacterium]